MRGRRTPEEVLIRRNELMDQLMASVWEATGYMHGRRAAVRTILANLTEMSDEDQDLLLKKTAYLVPH